MISSLAATRQISQLSGLHQGLETGGDSVTQLWFQHPPVAADVKAVPMIITKPLSSVWWRRCNIPQRCSLLKTSSQPQGFTHPT